MSDDDWMFPRGLHAAQTGEPRAEPGADLKIDPQFLSKRELRKRKLRPQPESATTPLSDFDRSIARSAPGFGDRMWTLGDTARWVIERTPEAVNGLSIDEGKLLDTLPEIQTAMSTGEVCVFANTLNDPVPRELPPETWSVYDLIIEEKSGLIRIFPSSSTSDYQQDLLNLRVRRDDVVQRWPDSSNRVLSEQPTTVSAENKCRRWLAAMMKNAPTQPRPKADLCQQALVKFPGLAKRGFDRAWEAAIRETKSQKWRAPGRRS